LVRNHNLTKVCSCLTLRPEHAKVFYSEDYPIESTYAVVFKKQTKHHPWYAALVVQPGNAGVVAHVTSKLLQY
jgi:hypothetical protein